MKSILCLFLIFISSTLFAQDKKDSIKVGWEESAVTGLNLSQVAFSDWSQGGDNSIAFTLFGLFGANYYTLPWKLENSLKLAYGRTKLGENSFRTNDNELYLESVLTYDVQGWEVDPYFSNTVRTVLSKGFDYKVDPAVQISSFFDPGYITQSLGLNYDRVKGFKTRLGLAIQETITKDFNQYSDDADTPNKIEKFKFETGLESVTEGEVEFAQNMLLNSKLRLFTRFNMLDVWDVRWDNTITAKVNDFVNVNFNVLIIYEKSQSLRTQIKEALQLGFTYTLL
jgi:Protein of unknown function (DUF3078)